MESREWHPTILPVAIVYPSSTTVSTEAWILPSTIFASGLSLAEIRRAGHQNSSESSSSNKSSSAGSEPLRSFKTQFSKRRPTLIPCFRAISAAWFLMYLSIIRLIFTGCLSRLGRAIYCITEPRPFASPGSHNLPRLNLIP